MPLHYRVLLIALLIPLEGVAQHTGVLQGSVTDIATGETLPGVSVLIPALNQGTATGVDGTYRIENLPAGRYEVRARIVGYLAASATVMIRAGADVALDFALDEDLLQLEEIVVTGTGGSIERRKLSADVAVINARDIAEAPVTTVDQLLQGRVAGAQVRQQSAQPGQSALINLRGITSVFGSQTPVLYIDGVRVDNAQGTSLSAGGELTSAIAELITSDIERIEVTKGGAASTLYGSDAANGVIQIFTKQGIAGKPVVTLRTEQGFDSPVTQFLNDTGFAFRDVVEGEGCTANMPDDPACADFGQADFIKDNLLQTGYSQNYYAGVSGGNGELRYNISGRLEDAQGVQYDNTNALYVLRGNLQAEVSPKLDVGFTGSYTRNNFTRIYNGFANADPLTSFEVGDAYFFTGTSTFEDAFDVFTLPRIEEGVNRFIFASSLGYTPSVLFASTLTFGLDRRDNAQRILNPAGADVLTGSIEGSLTRFDRTYTGLTLEYLGTISYPREGTITSDFTFGAQGFREDVSIITGTGQTLLPGTGDFGDAGAISADETLSEVFNGGVFFKEQLGLYDRVFVDVGLRLDGNSAFGGNVGLQAYPSLGVAYTLSDEPFWARRFDSVWSSAKLRIAYGETGRFPDPFERDFVFSSVGFRNEAAPRFTNFGNEDLKPERTSTLEGGVDFGFLSDRLRLSFTYFRAVTRDALLFVPEQPVTGQGRQLRNFGEIENRGLEFSTDLRVVNSPTVAWDLGLNVSWFENEVTDLSGSPAFAIGGITAYGAQQWVSEGEPVGAWRARVPVDTNGDGLPDDVEFQLTGWTPYPTTTGAFTTKVTFLRRLSLYAMMDFALGARVLDAASIWSAFNGIDRTPAPTRYDLEGNEDGTFGLTSSRGAGVALLKDGDFLKLRELSIRYALPHSAMRRFGLQRGAVFVTVRNLLTFTRDLGDAKLDPELAGFNSGDGGLELGGVQSVTLPAPRQFRLGLEVTL